MGSLFQGTDRWMQENWIESDTDKVYGVIDSDDYKDMNKSEKKKVYDRLSEKNKKKLMDILKKKKK